MPPLRLAVSQSRTLSTTSETLSALTRTVHLAAKQSIDLILFPEAVSSLSIDKAIKSLSTML